MMHPDVQNEQLKQNLVSQVERLVQQLSDLDNCQGDLDEEEYLESRHDTLEQLKEVEASMEKMMSGHVGLTEHISGLRWAAQAAIADAFKTPDVIRLVAERQPAGLRQRLAQLERDMTMAKIPRQAYIQAKLDILAALQNLPGGQLSSAEKAFFAEHSSLSMKRFVQTDQDPALALKAPAMMEAALSNLQHP